MINNILFYQWGAYNDLSMMRRLEQLNISYVKYDRKMEDYHADSAFAMEMIELIHQKQISAVYSFDYFPLISMLCEINRIPYITWIYDCPMSTLQSKTISNDSNYIYCFDKLYTKRLTAMGAKNCFHLPLAGDSEMLPRILQEEKKDPLLAEKYGCDISFVGSLYDGAKNRYQSAKFDDYTKGFLEGMICAQMKVYGYNFIREMMPDAIADKVGEACELKLGELYLQDTGQMAADMLSVEVTSRERKAVLRALGIEYRVMLYTGSVLPSDFEGEKIENKGYADYDGELPFIFHNSRINLNITSRSIESGVPLRVFDILSCGGFCLTNYQPEIAELFEDGRELVMYTGIEDALDKVRYYLEHEEERKSIAQAGYDKLAAQNDLSVRLKELFGIDGKM